MPVGLLECDDLLRGLKEKGPDATVTSVMRKPAVTGVTVPLNDAVAGMNRQGLRTQLEMDANGRLSGMLTLENVAETMIHTIRPGWKFLNQGK